MFLKAAILLVDQNLKTKPSLFLPSKDLTNLNTNTVTLTESALKKTKLVIASQLRCGSRMAVVRGFR